MDIKDIRQIVDLMRRSGLTEFELQENAFKLRICRNVNELQPVVLTSQPAAVAAVPVAAPVATPVAPASPAQPAQPAQPDKVIKSPMVGTFYAAPSPDSPPFVKVGDAVTPSTVVCILEAMKVMNEITADVDGTIAEVLVANGDSVEYGQPLFRLK